MSVLETIPRVVEPQLDVDELLLAAWDGCRIAVVCSSMEAVAEVLVELEVGARANELGGQAKVLRANGHQRIDFPSGGRIMLRGWRWWGDPIRGHSVDRVYLVELGRVPAEHLGPLVLAAHLAVATALEPRVVQVVGRLDPWDWPEGEAQHELRTRPLVKAPATETCPSCSAQVPRNRVSNRLRSHRWRGPDGTAPTSTCPAEDRL